MARSNMAGELLRKIREKKGIVQARLCQGLCGRKVLVRMETEGCYPQKQLLDAFFQRLGISANNFEHVYTQQEFEQARLRGEILEALQLEEDATAEAKLREYNMRSAGISENLSKQFNSLIAIILELQKNENIENEREILESIRKALQITIINFQAEDIPDYLLHDEEFMLIMLLAETLYKQGKIKEAVQIEYALAEYVDNNIVDEEEQLRFYPQIALVLANKLLSLNRKEGKYYCERAFCLLIKHQKINYLTELMEIILCYKDSGQHFEEWIIRRCKDNTLKEIKDFIPVHKQNIWQLCLVMPSSVNGYIFGNLIKNLRTALGLTQESFNCICEPLTLSRIEGGRSVNKNNWSDLMEQMGRNGEKCIPVLNTCHYKLQSIRFQFTRCLQNFSWDDAEYYLLMLERKLDENDPANAQYLISSRASLEMHQERISRKIYMEQLCRALCLTAPARYEMQSIKKMKINLTFSELLLLLKSWPLTQIEAGIWNQIAKLMGKMGDNEKKLHILMCLYENHIRNKELNCQYSKWKLETIYQLAEVLWRSYKWKEANYYCDIGIESSISSGDGYYLKHLLHMKANCMIGVNEDRLGKIINKRAILLDKIIGE